MIEIGPTSPRSVRTIARPTPLEGGPLEQLGDVLVLVDDQLGVVDRSLADGGGGAAAGGTRSTAVDVDQADRPAAVERPGRPCSDA